MNPNIFRSPFFRSSVLAAVLALLSSCAIGPDYHKPKVDVPDNYRETGLWKTAEPMDASPRGEWWKVYQDDQLNGFMATLDAQSPTIAEAEAQYREAEALLRAANAGWFPDVSLNAARTRGATTPGGKVANQNSVGASASWEVDVWGNVRRSIEAGRARQSASAAQLAAIRLSSQAQVASAYLQFIVTDQQLQQLQTSSSLLEETLRITTNQYKAGIVSEANVALADSQLKAAQAQLTEKRLSRAQLEHAIAVALGQAPANFSMNVPQQIPHLPQIPAGVPSTLLERRPDIANAERSAAEANAQIGIAKAALFPALTLAGSVNYKSSITKDLIELPNRVWSVGPQLALSLFDGGLRRAQTAQAIATYDASVANYRKVVLSAFQDVEDNLSAQQLLNEEAAQQDAAFKAAERAETIALNQYKAGTVSYLNVITAQNSRISAQNTLWNVKNRQYIASVGLISALGGDW